jgi:predicted dienelactone hydrolase
MLTCLRQKIREVEMKRKSATFFLLVSVFVFSATSAAWAKKVSDLKPIGIKLYHFEIQGRTAPAAVWYPAQKSGDKPYNYNKMNEGTAYLNAEPDRSHGPYPLLLFSHGVGACGFQSLYYVENLVRSGYVVAAMDHKDAAMCAMEGKKKVGTGQIVGAVVAGGGDLGATVFILFKDSVADLDFRYRPLDISGLLDHVLELNKTDPELKGLMNPDKIGMTGHSLGGFTTLAIAGAEYDCVDPAKYQDSVCKPVDKMLADKDKMKPSDFKIEDLSQESCCLPHFKGKDASFADPRVDAALSLAPANFFPPGAFKSIKMPVMIITGTGKFEVPFGPIQQGYDEMAVPKYLLHLKGVDHMTIADMAYRIVAARFVLPGFRTDYPVKKEIYEKFSVAFFDGYLKGDRKALDYIRQPNYELVELQAKP